MSTAVFSTCDVKFWHFTVSTFFTLPKQLILVYLGVLLIGGQSGFWIKFGLFGVAGGVTVAAGVWIWYKMAAIKKELIARQDRCRAEKAVRQQQQQAAAATTAETTPLGRSNSYNNLATEQPAAMYGGGYPEAEMSGQAGYQAYSSPQHHNEMGYGYAQSTPYPMDNNAGDLGTYQSYPQHQYPQPHDSPEQRKPVNPYPFV